MTLCLQKTFTYRPPKEVSLRFRHVHLTDVEVRQVFPRWNIQLTECDRFHWLIFTYQTQIGSWKRDTDRTKHRCQRNLSHHEEINKPESWLQGYWLKKNYRTDFDRWVVYQLASHCGRMLLLPHSLLSLQKERSLTVSTNRLHPRMHKRMNKKQKERRQGRNQFSSLLNILTQVST